MDIGVKSWFHLHPHLLLAALPRSPFQCFDLAQNDLCLDPDFCGAFSLLPVARLYFFLPLAVNPPPWDTDNFSPRPTERLGPLFRSATFLALSSSRERCCYSLLLWITFSNHLANVARYGFLRTSFS